MSFEQPPQLGCVTEHKPTPPSTLGEIRPRGFVGDSSWADEVDSAEVRNHITDMVTKFEGVRLNPGPTRSVQKDKRPPKNAREATKGTLPKQNQKSSKKGIKSKINVATKGKKERSDPNKLSSKQQKMHQDYQKHLSTASGSLLASFFGDNQPTQGVSELRFTVTDWINYLFNQPGTVPTVAAPIYTYYFDVGQPFFSPTISDAGVDSTRAKVRKVKLWFLTPPTSIVEESGEVPLLQVLTALPVKDEQNSETSLIGQGNTIIHPDVRRPWVMVGNWNWETIFENSQFQPLEYTPIDARFKDPMAMFTVAIINAVTGDPFSVDENFIVGQFKIELELQSPIPLVPTPLRGIGYTQDFLTQPTVLTPDRTPVQYSLKGVENQM